MALNYSHRPMSPTHISEDNFRPVSPTHISEDNLVSPVGIVNGYLVEGVNEKNGEVYSRLWHVSRDERNFSCGRDRVECFSSSEATSSLNDIVDLLPSDPFGMDIETTFTAITGWLEDLEADCGMKSNSGVGCQEGYGLFAGWNLIWNNSFKFQLSERLNTVFSEKFPGGFQIDQKYGDERGVGIGLALYDVGFRPACNVCNVGDVGFNNESASCNLDMGSSGEVKGASEFEGTPHEAFNYVLSYLGVKDLLSVERVCSSLASAVQGDPLFWKTIHIDQPLNERITDDSLVQLIGRAHGKLECLSLVECPKITDDGLRRILEANRRLTKLCVPGCTRINIECIVNCVRTYNSNNEFGGIKYLRIGGLYGVNHEHFEELNSLLGSGVKKIDSHHKPHFYHRGNFYLPYDDDRAMDIEMCPRCEKFRLVYDCPSEGCRVKEPQVCRACTLCIGRCAQCGRCINDTEFEETFCLELLCSDCFKQLLNYQDKLDKKVDSFGERDVFSDEKRPKKEIIVIESVEFELEHVHIMEFPILSRAECFKHIRSGLGKIPILSREVNLEHMSFQP